VAALASCSGQACLNLKWGPGTQTQNRRVRMRPEGITRLGPRQRSDLLGTLKARFEQNMHRHESLEWKEVQERLEGSPEKLWSLNEMEGSGGEPDLIGVDKATGEYLFADCSAESPKGRRSLCYDRQALEARKKHKPASSAVEEATAMGADLLTEHEYRLLQEHGEFDSKTSSWLRTPSEIRRLGGAIFGDYRYGRVFVYHNGAESYYASRGFRCVLRI
jgi:hypothetical protein